MEVLSPVIASLPQSLTR